MPPDRKVRRVDLHILGQQEGKATMATASDHEQFQLELINRARLDPSGEAERLGVGLNAGLAAGTISADPKQPLAFDSDLINAARGHSTWMLDADVFSHRGQGGSDPGDRMRAAGYDFTGRWTWGENIAYQGTLGGVPITDDTVRTYEGLFESPGHRTNLLGDRFQEIGLGIRTGDFQGFQALMVTQNFARSGQKTFVTGVAYEDSDGDSFYSPGEGRGGVRVTIEGAGGALSTVSTSSGGYQQEVEAGSQAVTFSGGTLAVPVTVSVEIADENVKLDLIDGEVVAASSDAVMGENLEALTLLGAADLAATGNALDNRITGNRGDNRLEGGAGDDTLIGGEGDDRLEGGTGRDTAVYAGARAGYQITSGDEVTTVRALAGGEGVDRLSGIELIQFSDQSLEIALPGDGPTTPPEIPEPPIVQQPEPMPPVIAVPEPESPAVEEPDAAPEPPAPAPPLAEVPDPRPDDDRGGCRWRFADRDLPEGDGAEANDGEGDGSLWPAWLARTLGGERLSIEDFFEIARWRPNAPRGRQARPDSEIQEEDGERLTLTELLSVAPGPPAQDVEGAADSGRPSAVPGGQLWGRFYGGSFGGGLDGAPDPDAELIQFYA